MAPAVVEVWAATSADHREASNAVAIVVSLIIDSRQEQQIIFPTFL
jgi:hypothetical protein